MYTESIYREFISSATTTFVRFYWSWKKLNEEKKITSFNRWDSFAQCSEKFIHWYSENAVELDYWFWGIVPSYTSTFFSPEQALFCNCNYFQVFISSHNYSTSYCKLTIEVVNCQWFRGVDSGLLHMVLLYSAPPSPIISQFTTVWWMTQHWGNLNTLST